jgi:alpha-tubulin suppressor-like RCC1 family protein
LEAHSLALKQDGTVFAWRNNGFGQCDVPDGLKEVVAIAAGNAHSMALKSDGTVVVWGDNSYGARAVPAGMSGANFIGAGAVQSLAATPSP